VDARGQTVSPATLTPPSTTAPAPAQTQAQAQAQTPGFVDWGVLVLPGVIWGASFLFIAEGLQASAPNGVTFMRIAVGFLTLSFIPAARKPIARADRGKTALLGIFWMAFPLSMFPFAEQHVSSALTGMLNGSTPLFAAIVASLIARRVPDRLTTIGLAIGLAGTILIALPNLGAGSGSGGEHVGFGVGLIMIAMVSYGVALNLARPLQQRNGALPVVWRALGVAAVVTMPLGLPAVISAHWTWIPLLSLLALGALGTGTAYVLVALAAGKFGATRASATTFLIPVVALILGMTLRGERVATLSIVGAGVCLLGAWLIREAGIRRDARH
jgi:drug/metabolite transporter (DMT)-like permease